jgi:miniconductance mechanosensitive channel
MSNSGESKSHLPKVSSFCFCDDQMLEQFKKYAIIKDYILKRKKRLKI